MLDVVLFDQLVSVLYLGVNVADSMRQGCFGLLLALVNQNSSYLLVYLRVLIISDLPSGSNSTYLSTRLF